MKPTCQPCCLNQVHQNHSQSTEKILNIQVHEVRDPTVKFLQFSIILYQYWLTGNSLEVQSYVFLQNIILSNCLTEKIP